MWSILIQRLKLPLLLASTLVLAQDNTTNPIAIYRSRPDLDTPILTAEQGYHDLDRMAPGYYFASPYYTSNPGIYIYDNNLNLIYASPGASGDFAIHNPQTCQYKGTTHLCFFQGAQRTGWAVGHGVIMDQHYSIVKTIEPTGTYQSTSDMHEFHLIENGTRALVTQYVRSVHDLCPWDLCDGLGYIQAGVFQEIDLETNEAIFTWNSLDHISTDESWVGPSTTEISGTGETPQSPWDYFHINSIDKAPNGDYLISARHTSALYRISGKDGSVLWRLNGAKSTYSLDGFDFSSQHDARWVEDTPEYSIITLFDNGSNGYNQTQIVSTGEIIRLDHQTKVATALKVLDPPWVDGHAHISKSQGNYQTLPNGNIILSWGSDPFWTEYTADGEIVFYGKLAAGWMMNYRTHKCDDWVGRPLWKPALWTYSLDGWDTPDESESGMMFYASWNGATEVASWRFFARDSKSEPWEVVAPSVERGGFETIWKYNKARRYAYAEARDAEGTVLGKSAVVETFVPNVKMKKYCDELACRFMPDEETRMKEKEETEQKEQKEEQAETNVLDVVTGKENGVWGAVVAICSFVVIGLMILALITRAATHFVSNPAGKILSCLRLRSRRSDETTRGKYSGLVVPQVGRSSLEESTDTGEDEMRLLSQSNGIEHNMSKTRANEFRDVT